MSRIEAFSDGLSVTLASETNPSQIVLARGLAESSLRSLFINYFGGCGLSRTLPTDSSLLFTATPKYMAICRPRIARDLDVELLSSHGYGANCPMFVAAREASTTYTAFIPFLVNITLFFETFRADMISSINY